MSKNKKNMINMTLNKNMTLNNDSHFIIIFFSCILFISFYLNTTYIINQLINQLLIN